MAEENPAKISKHMMIADVVQQYPQTVDVFMRNGLHCIGCQVAMFETIEQGAMAHMIDVNKLVKELNDTISSKKEKNSGKKSSFKTKIFGKK